jgi:hypothetical protein
VSRLAYRRERVQSQQVYFPQVGWRAIGPIAKELNPELRHRLGIHRYSSRGIQVTVRPVLRATASATRFHSRAIASELASCSRRRAWPAHSGRSVSSFRPWRCIAGCSIIDLRSLACEKEREPFMRRTACKGKLVISEAHECLKAAIAQVFKAN